MGAEVTTVSSTGAKKGVKKQRFELIPPRAIMELSKLYGRGAKKYAPNNFRLGYETSKSFGAGQRHAVLFWSGENLDTETQCHHMASFVWHCFTILESNVTHPEFDNRPYGAASAHSRPAHQTDGASVLSIAAAPQTIATDYRHDLLPLYPYAQVAEVFGAKPELEHSLGGGEVTYGALYGLAQDHANRYWSGENTDADTGLPNLALAAAYGLLLIELTYINPGADDRFLPGAPVGFDSVPVVAPEPVIEAAEAVINALDFVPDVPVPSDASPAPEDLYDSFGHNQTVVDDLLHRAPVPVSDDY